MSISAFLHRADHVWADRMVQQEEEARFRIDQSKGKLWDKIVETFPELVEGLSLKEARFGLIRDYQASGGVANCVFLKVMDPSFSTQIGVYLYRGSDQHYWGCFPLTGIENDVEVNVAKIKQHEVRAGSLHLVEEFGKQIRACFS